MLTIPNFITLLRLFLVPVILASLWAHDYQRALLFFVIAGLSDALDGFLARRLNQKTLVGAILDPIADKTLIDSIYLAGAHLKILPAWLAGIVVGRDVFILTGFLILTLYTKKLEVRPTYLSKGTTVAQVSTIVITLAGFSFQEIFFYFTGILTILSGVHYLWIGVRFFHKNKRAGG
ncbi:CDP-alcohol phosphatidyltransferase family protein [Thermodesulfatator atlanticus]|uniref:CDP-alcohol phosphatidyltransferase family protein n=1 Tax=Thermodesulfatator atlanticus TaxID=501497 RepID=UPI0003B6F858|nr:CDP-alcohol phosphatidyltransferase family protein [Thermodesulfatator atlanticus]